MIRILYRDGHGKVNAHLPVNDLAEALKDPNGLIWIDLAIDPIETVEAAKQEALVGAEARFLAVHLLHVLPERSQIEHLHTR